MIMIIMVERGAFLILKHDENDDNDNDDDNNKQ